MDLSQEQSRNLMRLIGGISLAVAVVLVNIRMNASWGDFPLFLVVAVPCVLMLWIAVNAKSDDDGPQGWQSAYLVMGVILALISLFKFRQILGSDNVGSGAQFWIFMLTAALAAYAAFQLNSSINTLLAALALAFAALAFVSWVGSDPGYKTFRWVLVLETIAFVAAARSIRADRPAHSHYLIDAAGVTALLAGTIGALASAVRSVIAAAFVGTSSGGGQEGNGWELFLLVVSLALIAYTVWERYWGTAYIGFVGLLAFIALVGNSSSLKWWPILLLIVGIAGVAAGVSGSGVGSPGPRRTTAAAAPPPEPPGPAPGGP
jgi:hypothetical protein